MKDVDNVMANLISGICTNHKEEEQLLNDWKSDTGKEEEISFQVWTRHENFLNRKKHEDEMRNCTQLADVTWNEKLERRYSPERGNQLSRNPRTVRDILAV